MEVKWKIFLSLMLNLVFFFVLFFFHIFKCCSLTNSCKCNNLIVRPLSMFAGRPILLA